MSEDAPAGRGRIFISYRREETAYPAGWLFDRLADQFGQAQVFKDIDSIEPGDDFVETITAAVGSCDVLLALIGDQWLTMTDGAGQRRLDDPNDFVRLEVEAALARQVRVVPILVGHARMPRTEELPASLAPLVRRQALELSPSRFETDFARLLRVLQKTLAQTQQPTVDPAEEPEAPEAAPAPLPRMGGLLSTPRRVAALAAAVLVALILVLVLVNSDGTPPSDGGDEPSSEEEPPPDEEGAWPVHVEYRPGRA